MKKYVAFLLAFCLMTLCTGCRRQTVAPTDTTASPSETATEPSAETEPVLVPPTAEQQPMVSIALPAATETTSAEDGTVIFEYVYQTISLTVPDPEVADTIILDFLNRIDGTKTTAESILSQARSDYTGSNGWTSYLCRVIYDPMRIDGRVLSLFGSSIGYSGGSHPSHAYPSVSYDMATGEVLTLPRILAIDDAGDKLCEYVIDALAGVKEEKYLSDDYADTVRHRLTGDLSDEKNWYFTSTGLCFYFTPYEIAPYSSGVVTAEVPYELLPGVIADAYLPAERTASFGDVTAEPFDTAALEQYTQFSEVVLEPGGQRLLLYTQGAVHDVRLQVGAPSYRGDFEPEYTAFAAGSLTPGDALMIEADIPEGAPRLRLIYTSGGETVSLLLTKAAGGGFQITEE